LTCFGTFRIVDDASPFGSVMLHDISSPRIDSVNVSSGSRTGGTAVFIQGGALDVGTLVVKFRGVASPQVDQRTATTARVVTPPASYTLNVAEVCCRLVLTPLLGSLSLDESFTAVNGSTGTVCRISGSAHNVSFSTLVGSLSALVGTNIVGGSGAVATVSSASAPNFQAGEMVSGLTNAAVAVVRASGPLVVDAPTGAFVEDELVLGATSGAVARLAPSAPYSGAVEICVENEYGRRVAGSSLVGALTYE
jgi:hypothetical protein